MTYNDKLWNAYKYADQQGSQGLNLKAPAH